MANCCFVNMLLRARWSSSERVADAINRGEGWMMTSIENLGLKIDEYDYAYRFCKKNGPKTRLK